MVDNQNLGPPIPLFWKKIVGKHHRSERTFLWDHFKLYLTTLGLVVWALYYFYHPSAMLRALDFGKLPKTWGF